MRPKRQERYMMDEMGIFRTTADGRVLERDVGE